MSTITALYEKFKAANPERPERDPIPVRKSLLVFFYTLTAMLMMTGIGYLYSTQSTSYIQYPEQIIAELGIDYDEANILNDTIAQNVYDVTFTHDGIEYTVIYQRATKNKDSEILNVAKRTLNATSEGN